MYIFRYLISGGFCFLFFLGGCSDSSQNKTSSIPEIVLHSDPIVPSPDTKSLIKPTVDAETTATPSRVVVSRKAYASPIDFVISSDFHFAYVANYDDWTILKFDLRQWKQVARFSVPVNPTGIEISPDNKILYITLDAPNGYLIFMDAQSGRILNSIAAGHTLISPLLSMEQKKIWVCDRFRGVLLGIDLDSKSVTQRIAVGREPVTSALFRNNSFLLVGNHLPKAINGTLYLSVIDLSVSKKISEIELPKGSTGLREIAVSEDGQWAGVTHLMMIQNKIFNVLSFIDLKLMKLVLTIDLANEKGGTADPWAIAFSAKQDAFIISHAGSHALTLIKMRDFLEFLKNQTHNNPEKGLSSLPSQRVSLPVIGPRAVKIMNQNLLVTGYFSDNLCLLDLTNLQKKAKFANFGMDLERIPQVRRGEMFFYEAQHFAKNNFSCASCHQDGRTNALQMIENNMTKDIKSVLFSSQIPSSMTDFITASDKNYRVELLSLYINSLQETQSPYSSMMPHSQNIKNGEKLFRKAGCLMCHVGPNLTTYGNSNVGTSKIELPIPSLVEIWRTAPYLHNGKAKTLHELLVEQNPKNNNQTRHGLLQDFSETDICDLIDYLLSL